MADHWATFGGDLHLELDPGLGQRAGLEDALRSAIRAGRLTPRTRLPSTRALAHELGLARNTVSAAYDQLVAEGYLSARQGSGTVVADLAADEERAASVPAHDLRPGFAVPPRYDLRPGSPDVTRFPVAAWIRAGRRALAHAPSEAFGYGDPRGRIELRTALSDYLARARGVRATPEQIVVTSGAMQALALVAGVLHARGTDVVAMEDPGVALHRAAVRRSGPRVVPVPVDENGARADLLDGCGAVVVTPAHQYPTGVTLRPESRQTLAEWARAGHVVIEDDYDGEFRYDRQPVGAVQGMAPEHVVYLGTSSKTLAPALRIAWLVLPPDLVADVADAKRRADHQTESLGQLTLAELITSHAYDRHVRAARLRYRRRRDQLVARLEPRAGRPLQGYALHGVAAGLHALVTLSEDGPSEHELIARAAARGLALEGLDEHWQRPRRPGRLQGLVVGFGTPSEAAYPAAIDALARVLSWP